MVNRSQQYLKNVEPNYTEPKNNNKTTIVPLVYGNNYYILVKRKYRKKFTGKVCVPLEVLRNSKMGRNKMKVMNIDIGKG
ncbi:hypothetical protein GDO81_029545 [Engystomops pustulosus]|uniref:Uncharacterized protein n=1 Tax=Engystomops pustulosus TaxID=76066 RepID=A0AAV6YUZ5_ENGPU|nr:hypothetical protein GDO81_029545 [Engystomops pustulosus]